MGNYVIRRLLLIIPTLILVTIIVFGAVRMVPGSVIDIMVSQMVVDSGMGSELTPEYVREALGLDVPIYQQYFKWMGGLVKGDLGYSLWTHQNVLGEIAQRIPVSFELGLMALILGVIVALPIGIYSAIRQDTFGDYLGRSIAIFALSVPNFWIATMVIVLPSIWWKWTPPMTYVPFGANPIGNLKQFIIPALIMGMSMSGSTMRMTRTMMLEVLRQDYIRTAWSKGMKERVVVIRHAMKNALIPVVTQIGMRVPVIIAGAVILEQIFNLPGIGNYLVQSINTRDYPIISGINLILAVFILSCNLVVDLTYAYLDPRIQYK
jgi:peptide/nickel transport system permease protein